MAQPQHQAPAPVFSPPQPSQSPAPGAPTFPLPPNKRPRLSPGPPSQPASPYATSPYAISPGTAVTPGAATSPGYTAAQLQLPAYNAVAQAPYTNGHSPAMSLSLPSAPRQAISQATTIAIPTPVQTAAFATSASATYNTADPNAAATYSAANLAPGSPAMPLPAPTSATTPGAMGPPTRPADRPAKEAEHDFADTLAGTGIDLHMEEQLANEHMFNSKEPAAAETRTGYGYHPPGSRSSFYGAGPANQPYEQTPAKTPAQLAAEAAEKAWGESAENLSITRTQEILDPFLMVAILHRKADKISKEYNLTLNMDAGSAQPLGRMRVPQEFQNPTVTVSTKTLSDSTAIVRTTGSWIPRDSLLVDQLALLSIATKQRVKSLIAEADRLATNRQKTSHGEVPEEWAAAAAPLSGGEVMREKDGNARTGAESAVSPRTNPLKRSFDATAMAEAAAANAAKLQKISTTNTLAATIRDVGRSERDWEEARLRRRNIRKEGPAADAGTPSASRSGSVAPVTPGSVAPEAPTEKAPTKKELKKNQAAKQAEAASHASQNLTSSLFAGLGRSGGLFGKKSGKSYSWMNSGSGGSGASTPTRMSTPGPGGRTASTPVAPINRNLTADGRNRMGTWREDQQKGKNIQLRDWITALEGDGIDAKSLQSAYISLDTSGPK